MWSIGAWIGCVTPSQLKPTHIRRILASNIYQSSGEGAREAERGKMRGGIKGGSEEKEMGGSERGSSVASCPIWTSLSCSSSNEEDKQRTLTTCFSVAMAIKCKSILTLSIFFCQPFVTKKLDFVYARVPWFHLCRSRLFTA